jgi:phage baseplate assembly protein W
MLDLSLKVLVGETRADGRTDVEVALRVTEDDVTLVGQQVTATVDFGDGNPVAIPVASAVLRAELTRALPAGSYSVRARAQNFRAPTADVIDRAFTVRVGNAAQSSRVAPSLIAPILPRDVGYPGLTDWNFDTGVDLAVLESSVLLILSTFKGQQLMRPERGTNLDKLVFEQDLESVRGIAKGMIENELTAQEPRVVLEAVNATRRGRELTLEVQCRSRVSGLSFRTDTVLNV